MVDDWLKSRSSVQRDHLPENQEGRLNRKMIDQILQKGNFPTFEGENIGVDTD
jgi:hypothetical protein